MNSRPRSVRRDERTPPRQLIIGDGSSVSAVSQTSDFFVQGPFGGFRSTARGHCPRANLTRDTSRDMEAQMSAAIALKLVYGEPRPPRPPRPPSRRSSGASRRTHPPLGRRLLFSVITPPRRRVARPRAPCAGGGDRPTRGASASKYASAFARGAVSRAVHHPRRPAPLPPRYAHTRDMLTVRPAFPSQRRTWNLIEDNSTDAVITWSSDGKSFVVKNPAALPALLPKRAGILKETYGGFLRELALYGFRCTGHDDAGNPAEFVCEGFERGDPSCSPACAARRTTEGREGDRARGEIGRKRARVGRNPRRRRQLVRLHFEGGGGAFEITSSGRGGKDARVRLV